MVVLKCLIYFIVITMFLSKKHIEYYFNQVLVKLDKIKPLYNNRSIEIESDYK